MTAREQARLAVDEVDGTHMEQDEWLMALADAASDVWEAVLRDIIRIASTGRVCPSDAAVIQRAKEALGVADSPRT